MPEESKQDMRVDRVAQLAFEEYGIAVPMLLGRSRLQSVIQARQLLMWLLQKAYNMSYSEIGRALRHKDHNTSMRSIKRFVERVARDEREWGRAKKLLQDLTEVPPARRESTERPSFQSIYMRLALMMSERSTCSRLKVGCVITSEDYRYVYGVGYNGNASGLPNQCDRETPGNCGDLHAEENAIINCRVSRDVKKVVFTTNLPCPMCAKRLINLGGVTYVYYLYDYRNHEGLEFLTQANIQYEQYVSMSLE